MANPNTPMDTASFAAAVDPGVQEHFVEQDKLMEKKAKMLAKFEDQTLKTETHRDYSGAGDLAVVAEGGLYTEDAMLEGYETTYTQVKYGSNLVITEEMIDFDLSGIAKAGYIAKEQAEAATYHIEGKVADLYNNGFTAAAANYSYGDNKPLFSTDHTGLGVQSAQSNASATGITLTDTNLDTAIVAFRGQKNKRGKIIGAGPTQLVVPPALESEALIITKSQNRSGTADNDVNYHNLREYTGGKLSVVCADLLGSAAGGSDTAWFLRHADKSKVMAKFSMRPNAKRSPDGVGFKTDTIYWKVKYRADFGWSDWRYVWGSKGDEAAYSS